MDRQESDVGELQKLVPEVLSSCSLRTMTGAEDAKESPYKRERAHRSPVHNDDMCNFNKVKFYKLFESGGGPEFPRV